MRILAATVVFLIFSSACDQSPRTIADSTESQSTTAPAPKAYVANLSVLTPLLPRRPVHLAVDPPGNLWFVQETDDGDDVTFIAGATEAPRATRLTSANVLAAAGAASTDRANIQSIASGANGEIYFYLQGGGKRNSIACFGRFAPRTGAIQILAGTSQLQSETGLGASIELARGTVVVPQSGRWLTLLVRHTDAAAMFRIDFRKLPPSGAMSALGTPINELHAPGETLSLTRADIELACGPAESILILDTWGGALWRIAPGNDVSALCSIVGISKQLSLPAASRDGQITLFAGDGEPIQPHVKQRIEPVDLELRYPSLLMLDGPKASQFQVVSRDDIRAPGGFAMYATQLQQLIYEPTRDSFVGFDSASGQIVRIKLAQKD